MDIKWKTGIELKYRVFARQLEDTTLRFEEMRDEMSLLFTVRTSFQETDEKYYPIHPEQLEFARGKGYFLMDLNGRLHLIVRSLPIYIVCDSLENAKENLDTILNKFGNKFAVARIVQDIITEVQAV